MDYELFKNKIVETIGIGSKKSEWFLYTPLLKRVMEKAVLEAKKLNIPIGTVKSRLYNAKQILAEELKDLL